MITEKKIENWFTHHPPGDQETIQKYLDIRDAGKQMSLILFRNTPAGADQSDAIRKVREAVMTANAAIACDGGIGENDES